ncbi:hypothetical protein [Vermiculatibacterium agrestimuris]|uniref:hypothetical protein n=1 Tax=Vermiculatibacterium agrestimuris TaxID=2941519 RepID=UPI00203BE03D|nr:hypothetical protein [Vermiculatibacterium agrestimuris]
MTEQSYYQTLADRYAAKHLRSRTRQVNVSSLKRTDNYRGKYPHDRPRPIPLVTSPTYEADVAAYYAEVGHLIAADGPRYPLTNKLDYVFFKRPMIPDPRVPIGPDGHINSYVQLGFVADVNGESNK